MKDYYFDTQKRIVTSAMCQTNMPILFLEAWVIDHSGSVTTHSEARTVVAIRTETFDVFSRRFNIEDGATAPRSPEALEESGWEYQGQETEVQPIIHDFEFGFCSANDEAISMNGCHRILIGEQTGAEIKLALAGLEEEARLKWEKKQKKQNS